MTQFLFVIAPPPTYVASRCRVPLQNKADDSVRAKQAQLLWKGVLIPPCQSSTRGC